MYKVLKRTCKAIVLLIKSFVLPCTRCRRRRGLLKILTEHVHGNRACICHRLHSELYNENLEIGHVELAYVSFGY